MCGPICFTSAEAPFDRLEQPIEWLRKQLESTRIKFGLKGWPKREPKLAILILVDAHTISTILISYFSIHAVRCKSCIAFEKCFELPSCHIGIDPPRMPFGQQTSIFTSNQADGVKNNWVG